MSLDVIATEKVVSTRIFKAFGGAYGTVRGVLCPWMVEVNGEYTLGEFEVARYQPDPMVFGSKKSAEAYAARLVTVTIHKAPGQLDKYAVKA